MRTFILLALFCLLILVPEAVAQSPQQNETILSGFVINGYKDGRDRLRSGAYRLTGTYIHDDPEFGILKGNIRIVSAFDFDRDLFRFDEEYPTRGMKPGSKREADGSYRKKSGDDWELAYTGGKYVRTPKKMIYWLKGGDAVVIKPPHFKPPANFRYFDVRIIGACSVGDVEGRGTYTSKLDYFNKEASKFAVRDGRFWRLDLRGQYVAASIWLDPDRQYVPVRYEARWRDRPPNSEPNVSCTTEWKSVNDVWVPRAMKLREGVKPGDIVTYDVTFEWDYVNKHIPDEVFSVNGMELSAGTKILSDELGNTLLLGTVGDKRFPEARIDSPVLSERRAWWKWPVIGAGIFLPLGAGAMFLYRRHKLRHSPATPPPQE